MHCKRDKTYVFNKNGNEMRDKMRDKMKCEIFYQRFVSLHFLGATNARKKSIILTFLFNKVLYFFSSITLKPLTLVSQCTRYSISFTSPLYL